jgi:hypothetical protein
MNKNHNTHKPLVGSSNLPATTRNPELIFTLLLAAMFSQQISEWQIFFATVAGTSATLMGLIFLSLSLKLDVLRQMTDKTLRQMAWQTFANFFFLIMFALVFLVPNQTPLGIALPLFIICIVAIAITISRGLQARSIGLSLIYLLKESVPSLLAYLGMITVVALIYAGKMQALVWLLPIIIILLAIAVRNAWTLLVGVSKK